MSVSFKTHSSKLQLSTGAYIPQVGLGSANLAADVQLCYSATLNALKAGYRHIDTASAYRNEIQVGKAINDSGIPRNEIFVTSKLGQKEQRNPKKAFFESLDKLGLDYLDLYLIHWPVVLKQNDEIDTEWDFADTWLILQELIQEHPDKVKAIGVSNFSIKHLQKLFATDGFKITPAINQVEIHPLHPNTEVLEFSKKHGIIVEAYSPLGAQGTRSPNPYFGNKDLEAITKERNLAVAQLLIGWGVKRGYVVLPKSSDEERIVSNFKDIQITDDEFQKVTDLIKSYGEKRIINNRLIDWSNE